MVGKPRNRKSYPVTPFYPTLREAEKHQRALIDRGGYPKSRVWIQKTTEREGEYRSPHIRHAYRVMIRPKRVKK